MDYQIKRLINEYNDCTPLDQNVKGGNVQKIERELAALGYYAYKDAGGTFSYAARDGVSQEGRIDPDSDHHYTV